MPQSEYLQCSILVFGSIMRDTFHLLPTQPTHPDSYQNLYVLKEDKLVYCWGGKGLNQAVALYKSVSSKHTSLYKFNINFAGSIGDDVSEKHFAELSTLMPQENLQLTIARGCSTGRVEIIVNGAERTVILHPGANAFASLPKKLKLYDWIVLQDEVGCTLETLRRLKGTSTKVLLNASPVPIQAPQFWLHEAHGLVDILIVNEGEAQSIAKLLGCDKNLADEDMNLLDFIGRKCSIGLICMTCGPKGALALHQNKIYKQQAIRKENIVDTTAAGDTWLGYFLIKYIESQGDIRAAMLEASQAAAQCIQTMGSSISIPSKLAISQ